MIKFHSKLIQCLSIFELTYRNTKKARMNFMLRSFMVHMCIIIIFHSISFSLPISLVIFFLCCVISKSVECWRFRKTFFFLLFYSSFHFFNKIINSTFFCSPFELLHFCCTLNLHNFFFLLFFLNCTFRDSSKKEGACFLFLLWIISLKIFRFYFHFILIFSLKSHLHFP